MKTLISLPILMVYIIYLYIKMGVKSFYYNFLYLIYYIKYCIVKECIVFLNAMYNIIAFIKEY